jgi:outer membrane lipoprotein-sorting protein
MTSGKNTMPARRPLMWRIDSVRRTLLGATLCLYGLTAAAQSTAAAFDIAALSQLLRGRQQAEASFIEERFVNGLDAPLQSSGTLSFQAPDRFARRTLLPRPESMVVEGNTVVLQRGGRTRQMAVDAAPELAALVNALRGTFTGDLAALQQAFDIQLQGRAQDWRLTLVPRSGRVAALVRLLEISGRQADVRRMELVLTDGDRSVMQITSVANPAAPAANR